MIVTKGVKWGLIAFIVFEIITFLREKDKSHLNSIEDIIIRYSISLVLWAIAGITYSMVHRDFIQKKS